VKNLFVITNDSIDKKKNYLFTNSSDLENILGAFQKKTIFILCRKFKTKKNFKIKKNKIKIINFFKFLRDAKENDKILFISITPFNFINLILLKIFLKKKIDTYLYLRSDGFKEYKIKFKLFGYFFYGMMFVFFKKFTKIISCSKHLSHVKKFTYIDPSKIDKNWLINRVKPKLAQIKLLYVGRMKKEKGIFSLINLLENIPIKYQLTILGSKYNNIIKANENLIIYKKELYDHKKIKKYYDNCNLFVLPSYTEGNPQVIKESFARQRPVIVFEDLNFLSKQYKGIIVSKRNKKNLHASIKNIFKNYNYFYSLSKKNKIILKENFRKNIRSIIF
tara:strand:- start:4705 stop:5706 length:1002 start_codon:yes stop_codon:yes gene_type:complete